MIRNDEQLAIEQKQLGLIEAALESLRQRVFPKNPRNFAVYSEAYIDQINIIKAQIDEYLARKQSNVPDPASTPSTPPANVP